MVLAVRELALQTEPGTESRDLVAFISLALAKIADSIDISVSAWEKRGYWVKADKFRLEWAWAGEVANKMKTGLAANDWNVIAQTAALIAQKLNKITVSSGNRMGKPWIGAWNILKNQK